MAEGDLARLVVTLEASTKAYERALAKAQGTSVAALKRIEKEAAASGARFDAALASGFGGFKQVAAAIVGFQGFSLLHGEIKRLADIDDVSQKVGLAAETIQSLQFAASQAGSSADEMNAALLRFSKEAGGAGQKSSELGAFFRANGIAFTDAAGRLLPLEDLLVRYAKLVANAANDQEAANFAAIGFGKAGAGMVPVLRDIAGGLDDLKGKAKEAGVIVAEDLVKRAGQFDDAWNAAILSIKAGIASLMLEATKARPFQSLQSNWAQSLAKRDATGIQSGVLGNVDGMTEDQIRGRLRALDALAADLEVGKTTPEFDAGFKRLLNREKTTVAPPDKGGGDKADAYDRQSDSIEKKIKLLEAEASAIGKTKVEQEKAKTVAELENSVTEAGLPLTAERRAEIDKLATSYANAAVRVDTLEKAQRDMIASLDAVRSTAGSTLGTFANDLAEGVKMADALKTAMDSVRTAIINALANQFVTALLGAPGTAGPAGGLFSTIFGGGRAGGGAVAPGREYRVGENGPERFVPTTRGRIEPIAPVRAAGGTTVIRQGDINVTAPNASGPELVALRREVGELRSDLTRQARASAAQKRGMRA